MWVGAGLAALVDALGVADRASVEVGVVSREGVEAALALSEGRKVCGPFMVDSVRLSGLCGWSLPLFCWLGCLDEALLNGSVVLRGVLGEEREEVGRAKSVREGEGFGFGPFGVLAVLMVKQHLTKLEGPN